MSGQVRFPGEGFFSGWGEPMRTESDLRDLEVIQGQVPEDLNGVLYRCGPETQYPPMVGGPELYFNGEGMVHMFRFSGGHVDYRNRYVRNERFLAQAAARRSLFGRYRNRVTNDPGARNVNPTTANTHIVWHAGKLFALKEDGLPIEIDPSTLETGASWDGDGAVRARWLSAHPKIDEATGEMVTFAYQALGEGTRDVALYVVDPDGRVSGERWFEAPYPGNVHDFALAGEYAVFGFYPLITDIGVLEAGGPFYQWHRDTDAHFAVVRRDGQGEIRWFRGPACFAAHNMNAFSEGGKVHLDCDLQRTGWQMFPNHDGAPHDPAGGVSHLSRITFDLDDDATGYRVTSLVPEGVGVGMSRSDDRYQGMPYRHGYFLYRSPGEIAGGAQQRSVAHVDHETGTLQVWQPGPDSSAHEPCFVPRAADAPEGDGYLMACVNRYAEHRSDLVILDALRVDGPPVATVKLPIRVRLTFHGSWVPGDELAAAAAAGKE